MNNIYQLYKHLDKLCPITSDGHIDMTNVNSFSDLCRIFDVTEGVVYDWIFSHYPDKEYSMQWGHSIQWGYSIVYYKEDKLHRDGDLPAIITADGDQEWWQNGKRQRDGDLPAIIYPDGTQYWYQNGLLHRNGGPAIIYPNGTQYWYQNGDFIK